jgi:hypothetical protein
VDESRVENADNLEDALDAEGRNLTQQRMDAEGVEDRPVDVPWQKPAPAVAEADVVFEPDVPLAAEVNREAVEETDRKRRFALLAAAAAVVALLARRLRRR